MRVSRAGLLVAIAFLVPVIVELRTALVWVGIDLTVLQTVLLALFAVAALLAWAVAPDVRGSDDDDSESPSRPETPNRTSGD
ncbi:CbaC protein [Natronomonas pharaonis DSM 2160]|uniref:CbaC protein n=2 Tax=Natronomonas pharaonis TaxID=2257 RepID=A0A1U7EWS9_NATPD|nr:hypothetical protein [Natronomonas pharaonis]CAA71526.1 subunit III of membrane protein [Natronomonas pharaonis]CAI49571.1 CbaC protein [Natronomonas pharaonis DSM 2160]